MFPLAIVAEPPTDVIWWTLLRYYLFLGFAAGTIVTVLMLYWVVKYRAKDVQAAPKYHHEEESGWGNWRVVVLTLLITGGVLAFVEYETFASEGLVNPPVTNGDPIYINVTGQQFAWTFTYPNGHFAIDNLTVPADEIVVLNITSIDVDHSFTIESLSVAKDAIPGQHNFLWFNATQTGFFLNDIRCKELCGIGHANMLANFTVVSQASYNKWYAGLTPTVGSSTTASASGNGPTTVVDLPQGAGGLQKLNFSPSTLSVTSGTTIQFVDQDNSAPHNVYFTSVPAGATNPNGSGPPIMTQGSTYSVTLTTPGTYTYECQFHSAWMQGTITVTS